MHEWTVRFTEVVAVQLMRTAEAALLSQVCTHLGLRGSPDGPDAVQSVARLHPLGFIHLTGANDPVEAAQLKLTVWKTKDSGG